MTEGSKNRVGVRSLLTPQQCALVLIDCQPQMAFTIHSIDRHTLLNNLVGLAKAAKSFNVPTITTNVRTEMFSGPTFQELRAVQLENEPIERTTMNCWDDEKFVAAVKKTGRRKLLLAGLWTEVSVALPAISALGEDFDVCCVADACGGVSREAHDLAIQRMIQAGVVPMTWTQVLLEWQRDWARAETYPSFLSVVQKHAAPYAIGIQHTQELVGGSARRS